MCIYVHKWHFRVLLKRLFLNVLQEVRMVMKESQEADDIFMETTKECRINIGERGKYAYIHTTVEVRKMVIYPL